MAVTPLYDYVLVQRIEEENKTPGGIVLPDTAKEKQQIGKVIAVGQGKLNTKTGELIPLSVKEGDKVVFGKYAGTDIKIDGEEYSIMKESEILAILKD
ncbi:MAG: co-chaperone GroES [Planctomycetota bacterium]|nr:MAG: co-chaperone GroES [Planctomycetota bacterium]